MKTASVRDLRNNFAKVSRWLEAGENVEITKYGIPYAKMELKTPPPQKRKHVSQMSLKERRELFRKRFGPDHTRWLKQTYGGKKLSGNSALIMREGSKW